MSEWPSESSALSAPPCLPLCTLHTSQVVHVPLGEEVAQGVFLSTRWHHAGAWILAVPELVPSGIQAVPRVASHCQKVGTGRLCA